MNDVHRQIGDLTELTPGNEVARAQLDARIRQLEGELSLAVEGLANYAQELAELKKDHEQYSDWVTPQLERLGREMVENDRLKPLAEAAIAYVKCWKENGHAGLDEWSALFNAAESFRQPQSAPIDTVSGNGYSTVHGKDESGTAPGTAREAREDGSEAV